MCMSGSIRTRHAPHDWYSDFALPWPGSSSHTTVVAARDALKQSRVTCVTGVEPHLYAPIGLLAHAGRHDDAVEFSNDGAVRRILYGNGQSFVAHGACRGGKRAVVTGWRHHHRAGRDRVVRACR